MGSIGVNRNQGGSAIPTERIYRDNTNDVGFSGTMQDAYFKNAATLVATINKADNGRFDILSRSGSGASGTILYTDAESSDGEAYEIYWQRTYANDNNPSEIQVIRFRRYEQGEW